ncbi:MAG: hypothetical protein NC922_08435 [Candidatus Omnitrophica bacterium]|nr:hypothetical protein [Candidatus Omnitrophota bacterium]
MNNLKQLGLSLLLYAEDYDGWFPAVTWGESNCFVYGGYGSWSTWFPASDDKLRSYITNPYILCCPSADPKFKKHTSYGFAHTVRNWNSTSRGYFTSYIMIAGIGTYPMTSSSSMYGRILYHGSTPEYPRAPVPNIKFCGKTISRYNWTGSDYYGPIYVQPADQQPMIIDAWRPNNNPFFYGVGYVRNNHADGENIVYCDGHVAWKSNSELTIDRYQIYYGRNRW